LAFATHCIFLLEALRYFPYFHKCVAATIFQF
jgi:hypothetical protein